MMRLFALCLLSARLWAAEPFIGTWEMDLSKSRIDNPELLKGVEMTFIAKGGGEFGWSDAQYRVDGRVLRREIALSFAGAPRPVPDRTGVTMQWTRLDSATIQRINKRSDKVSLIAIYSVYPDGETLVELVHAFDTSGKLSTDETIYWRRRK
jgi:hypothetical protein